MSTRERTQEDRYARVQELTAKLAKLQQDVADVQRELYAEVRDAFPENRGGKQKRGVLTEVAKRSPWTREYVAKIRDGNAAAAAAQPPA
ncbi:hypothetical protein ACFY0G_02175 [Streptomyces sp. NPDC001552]|uniref:hypothetical protein n=1 Tax=Streptomyces sp. NPDC001552 TaxID=3364587 RepID=UPI0036B1683E